MPPRLTRRHALTLLALGAVAGCSNGSTTARTAASPKSSAKPSGSKATTSTMPTLQTITYGTDQSQFGELLLPGSIDKPLPVVVVVHGGYWGSAYGLSLGTPLAEDLALHGVAAWNIEYRRIGIGGGWPGTFVDVANAMDALADKVNKAAGGRLDLTKVVVVGHSAGGQIAGWLAGRHKLKAGDVGASPKVSPIAYVSQAGVLDLVGGQKQSLGGGAIDELMGGSPSKFPERYAVGSPYALLPLGVPGTLVHGLSDTVVPISQSDTFAAKAKQLGDDVTEVRMPGVDHFMLIDATTPAWAECRKAALGYLAAG